MVLPYLKDLINEDKHFYIIFVLALEFIISENLICLQVRYITCGIRAISWAKWGEFFSFILHEFFGENSGNRVCRSDLKTSVQNFQKQIADMNSLGKNTPF